MASAHVLDHPLLQHKVSMIRDKNTGTKEFRELVKEIAMLMVYEVTRDMPPLKRCGGGDADHNGAYQGNCGQMVGIVPILRAGLGMVEGVLNLIPGAKVGHIGLYRDPDTFEPVEYYCKLPVDAQERELIVLDPMLATGGSAPMRSR